MTLFSTSIVFWALLGPLVYLHCAFAADEQFFAGKTIRLVLGFGPGGGYDRAARLISKHMGKHIPGSPEMVVQHMPGAGSLTAANYVYSVAKPDGLTLLMAQNNIYLSQLSEQKEVMFDVSKFQWIGALEKDEMLLFVRANTPFKTIGDVVRSKEPLKCGASGVGSATYVVSKILEETIGAKIEHVVGYSGSPAIALALERAEVGCMGTTVSTIFSGEPYSNWYKTGFVRFLIQAGRKRDARLGETPTIYEVMDEYKTPSVKRRVAETMLLGGEWARALLTTPATPSDRVNTLRAAYQKATQDPELLAEAKKLRIDIEPTPGDKLQDMAKEVTIQPSEAIKQIKSLFVQ